MYTEKIAINFAFKLLPTKTKFNSSWFKEKNKNKKHTNNYIPYFFLCAMSLKNIGNHGSPQYPMHPRIYIKKQSTENKLLIQSAKRTCLSFNVFS